MRASGRADDALRPISVEPGSARRAEGSCLIRIGGTEVLCAASAGPRVTDALMRLARLGTAGLHARQSAALEAA